MEQHFWAALIASLRAACVTTVGILVIRRFEGWGRKNATYFVSFAAGILITVSILHIIPRSFAMQPHGPALVLAGYMAMYISNRFITTYVCDRPESALYAIGLVPMLGIGAHSFLDGVVYSVTFTVSVFTGTLSASLFRTGDAMLPNPLLWRRKALIHAKELQAPEGHDSHCLDVRREG